MYVHIIVLKLEIQSEAPKVIAESNLPPDELAPLLLPSVLKYKSQYNLKSQWKPTHKDIVQSYICHIKVKIVYYINFFRKSGTAYTTCLKYPNLLNFFLKIIF